MSDQLALFFGCLRDKGHFLWHPRRHTILFHPEEVGFPSAWEPLLDTGLLRNGCVPDRYNGEVHHTVAGSRGYTWHAFYWWDRSIDQRPGSNAGFYVRGFDLRSATTAWAFACETWPEVIARQTVTLALTPAAAVSPSQT